MKASHHRLRESVRTATSYGDSVFRSQALLAGAVGLVVGITLSLSNPGLQDSASFFVGLTIIVWSTIAAATIPWLRFPVGWQVVIPLADIIAMALLRLAAPQSGFGILLIFPVIWLATSFGRFGSVLGPLFAAGLLWSLAALARLDVLIVPTGGSTSLAATASISITLAFVSGVIHATSRRVESQRALLRRQTQMLERALTRARVQEATVRETFDAVEFAVVSLDLQGRTLTANRAARGLLGELGLPDSTPWDRVPLYRADEVTPLPPDEFPQVRVLAGDVVDNETYWIGHRTGTRFAIHATARLLHDQGDVEDRVVLVLRDVSVEVRALADRDDLFTSMSHELRTPLSSVLGYIDLTLEVDDLPQPAREMLDIALANTQRLNTLVSDMLMARSTSHADAMSLTIADSDLVTIVTDSIDAIRVNAAERLIPITLDAPDHLRAPTDAFRIRQVVDNLLSNAVKYNSIGGRVTVAVREVAPTTDGGDRVEIAITDTGRGMTLEEQKGLFQRFYRAESVRGSTTHGTGLGLSICHDIVSLHGGSIEVASRPGEGTEVVVSLPRVAHGAAAPISPTTSPEEARRP